MIRRADPALHQLDQVLAILAAQNRVLGDARARLRRARSRRWRASSRAISEFIDKAGATATGDGRRAATRWSRTSRSSRRS